MTLSLSAVLQADGLQFSYPGARLFEQLSFALPPGVSLVLGGDGSGKSTLMRLLAATLKLASGTLAIHGADLASRADSYRSQVFWIEPREEDFDQLTPLAFFSLQKKRHPDFDETLLSTMIAGLSLQPHLDKQLYMLSTGSKRKVWLAAAFASRAAVVLLDDPFAGLDRMSINFLLDRLRLEALDTTQAWVMAMYETPADLPLATIVELCA